MEPQDTIDRLIAIVADELHEELGAVAIGDALVAFEICRNDGGVGIAYLSNVPAQGQVQLLARVLSTVSGSGIAATHGEDADAE